MKNKNYISSTLRNFIMCTIVCTFVACNSCHRQAEYKASAGYVFVCTGEKAKRYHLDENCRGLSNCSKEIIEVTIEKAESKGRTPCKKCAQH